MKTTIRPATNTDILGLIPVVDATELFPSEYLEDMMSDYFNNSESGECWYTLLHDEIPIGFAYSAPEKFTEGTFNLLAIGILPNFQGNGLGAQLISHVEQELTRNAARILIVDTSGTDDFELTRNFYLKNGYDQEAIVRDYWAEGDDKVTFRKKLN